MPLPKILVIDDNLVVLSILKRALQNPAYDIVHAESYWIARAILQAEKFEVVILDWELDGGHTGAKLLQYISADTKIILHTSAEDEAGILMLYPTIKYSVPKGRTAELKELANKLLKSQ